MEKLLKEWRDFQSCRSRKMEMDAKAKGFESICELNTHFRVYTVKLKIKDGVIALSPLKPRSGCTILVKKENFIGAGPLNATSIIIHFFNDPPFILTFGNPIKYQEAVKLIEEIAEGRQAEVPTTPSSESD